MDQHEQEETGDSACIPPSPTKLLPEKQPEQENSLTRENNAHVVGSPPEVLRDPPESEPDRQKDEEVVVLPTEAKKQANSKSPNPKETSVDNQQNKAKRKSDSGLGKKRAASQVTNDTRDVKRVKLIVPKKKKKKPVRYQVEEEEEGEEVNEEVPEITIDLKNNLLEAELDFLEWLTLFPERLEFSADEKTFHFTSPLVALKGGASSSLKATYLKKIDGPFGELQVVEGSSKFLL